jgi:phosphate transport system substrate-binding protein
MKNRLLAFTVLLAIILGFACNNNSKKTSKGELKGTITISGAFALYPLAVKWKEEFEKLHPAVRIDVSAGGAGKGMADVLAGMVNIGMVSREVSKEELNKGAWYIAVTKDAVVPIINADNPAAQELLNQGLSKEAFKDIFITGKSKTWGDVLKKKKSKEGIKVFTRSDACGAADIWAKYLGKKQEDLLGVGVYGDPGVTQAVQNEKLGIGYNNIAYAYDSKSKFEATGIKIVPIDLNNNGVIDDGEFFYQHKDSLINAIATGRYPSPPARDLYFVCKGKPTDEVAIEFLKWVLTDGQKYVYEAGYIKLKDAKIKESLQKLD